MLRVPTVLRDSDRLMKAARAVAHSPIVDHDGAYCGTVSAHCVAEALADGEHDGIHVSEVIDLPQHCARSTGIRVKITRRRMGARSA
jgi:xanthine/CO dehydrogenase XdhC/CoxF family maturation factor